MSTLHLVRHGQAAFGSDEYDQLSDLGRQQSEAIASHWLKLRIRLDRIYSGAMTRQRDSAQIVVDRCATDGHSPTELRILDNFNEYSFLPLLVAHADELRQSRDGADFDWNKLWTDRRLFNDFLRRSLVRWSRNELSTAGVEPWGDFKRRCVAGLERVIMESGRGKTIAVFSSAGAIGASIQHVLQVSDEQTIRLMLGLYNTSVTTLLYNEREVSLSSYNSVAHLENETYRELITYR